jgi:hypothetical protein
VPCAQSATSAGVIASWTELSHRDSPQKLAEAVLVFALPPPGTVYCNASHNGLKPVT